jgi:hypothetical protein
MKKLLFLAILTVACHAVHAGDTTAASKGSPTVDVKPASSAYEPKHRSTFSATATAHNPFWPIGWVKTEALNQTADAPTMPHAEDFTVTTIMLNDPPMAVINGKDMAEGEVAALNAGGRMVTVQLMAVQDGRVILRWQNQNIVVPLHRDEQLSASASVDEMK